MTTTTTTNIHHAGNEAQRSVCADARRLQTDFISSSRQAFETEKGNDLIVHLDRYRNTAAYLAMAKRPACAAQTYKDMLAETVKDCGWYKHGVRPQDSLLTSN